MTPLNNAVMGTESAAVDLKMPAPGDNGYEEWRKTGKLPESEGEPEEKAEKETPQVQEHETGSLEEEDSATSDSVTPAAASEAARPQKGKKTADARKAELSNEIRDLANQAAELRKIVEEARTQASAPRETKQEAQPAADAKKSEAKPEPQLDDKNSDGSPKYKTFGEYQKDWSKWVFSEAERRSAAVTTEHLTKTQLEQRTAEAQRAVDQAWGDKVSEARTKYPDFDTVAKNLLAAKDANGKPFFLPRGSAIDQFLLESPHGAEVFYHLAQHANEESVQRIFELTADNKFKMSGVQQVRALDAIERQFETPAVVKPKPSATVVTKAPPPPHQVQGKPSTSVDEEEQAVKEGDFAAFAAAANAKALEKAARGRRRA